MSRGPYDLPSLHALAAFEAAARHGSFKAAAAELNVTPAAISHQVKALEADLARPLFDRHRRGVDLTDGGRILAAALRQGFERLSDGVAAVRRSGLADAVTVRATTAVSQLWLTPRLAQFWKSHGRIAVNQVVTDRPAGPEPADLEIVYGPVDGDDPGCHRLFGDRIVMLAAPGVVDSADAGALAQLARLPLIHLDVAERAWSTWRTWFDALGHRGPIAEGVTVNNYTIALQVARDGVGPVLGWERLTRPLIEAGDLVRIGDHALPAPFDFAIRDRGPLFPRAALLRDWLVAAA
jgi:DNA-binding transcriptional LysR family regulator